jgi:hypothetical protein
MDYDAVRQGLEQAIPYNRYIGLDVVEVADGRGVTRSPTTSGCRTTSARSTPATTPSRQ